MFIFSKSKKKKRKAKKQGFISKGFYTYLNFMLKPLNDFLAYGESNFLDAFKAMIETLINSTAKRSFNNKQLKLKTTKAKGK